MNAHNDLDRQLNDFLRDGPTELPYQSFDAVRDRTEQTGQRVVIGPWRLPEMNKTITFGLGAAAVVIVGLVLGYQFLGLPGNQGSGGEPTATPEVTATPVATSSPVPATPLSQTYTSLRHGISASYPEGWNVQEATGPWTDTTFPLYFGRAHADWIYHPILLGDLFLVFASQPLGDSTAEDWAVAQMDSEEGCPAVDPVSVDGASGLIGKGCNMAVVTSGGRGYWIQLYTSSDDPSAVASYDRAWFEEFLAGVQLHPADAAD